MPDTPPSIPRIYICMGCAEKLSLNIWTGAVWYKGQPCSQCDTERYCTFIPADLIPKAH